MSEIDEENVDSTNDTTEEVVKTDDAEETDAQSGTEEPKYTESEMKSYARMKKAEAETRQLKKELDALKAPKVETKVETKPSEKQDGLMPKDLYALMEAKVPQDDVDVVTDYAAFKKITVAEALKSSVVKTELAERAEKRQTAEATNTGNARRGTSKPSDEQILANAEKGKFPEDAEVLAEARMNAKKNKK